MADPQNQVEMTAWAESLRDQLSRISGRKKNGKAPGFDASLKGDLLDAIDLLLEHVQDAEPEPDPVAQAVDQVLASVDTAIDKFDTYYHEALESLTGKQSEVSQQIEVAIEKASDAALRTEVVCESLDRVGERQAEQVQALAANVDASRESIKTWEELIEGSREETETLRKELKAALATFENPAQSARVEELEQELSETREQLLAMQEDGNRAQALVEELDDVQSQFRRALEEKEELEASLAAQAELATQAQGEQAELETAHQDQLSELRTEIELLTEELEIAKAEKAEANSESDSGEHVEEFEDLLRTARQEIEDLRTQNSDLAAKVANQEVLAAGKETQFAKDPDSLTWEDRKRLIMRQLEDESLDGSEEGQQKRLEIADVIAATEHELQRKEQELEEMRREVCRVDEKNQLEEDYRQKELTNLLDSDESVQKERAKLQDIQQEWEEKLRQAEIDLSMERARLARERRELEAEKQAASVLASDSTQGKGRTRKWLDHLGLREDPDKPE